MFVESWARPHRNNAGALGLITLRGEADGDLGEMGFDKFERIFIARAKVSAQVVTKLRLAAGEAEDALTVIRDVDERVIGVINKDGDTGAVAAFLQGPMPVVKREVIDAADIGAKHFGAFLPGANGSGVIGVSGF